MFAIVDIETTGLSPVHDRIIEIAIVIYDGREITETFSSLVSPQLLLPPGIIRLTGITNEVLQDAPQFYEIARKIVELTENKIFVAHNVRFDYSFVRQSFRRLGYNFYRRQLCTFRLSRKHFPGLPSYSLGSLCRFLNIEAESEHRAIKDALATLRLFEKLHPLHNEEPPGSTALAECKETFLPPGISHEDIAKIPEETGVYFFYDEREKLIYVGKSKNIRKRILSHFSGDLKSSRSREMKNKIRQLRYEVTGSELVALLRESELIKKHQPPYNRDQRNTLYLYGIFSSMDGSGYLRLSLERLPADGNGSEPLLSFTNRMEAMEFLEKLLKKYDLCQKLCGIHKTGGPCFSYHTKGCQGACIGKELPPNYNKRVKKAIWQFEYALPSFLVIGRGRRDDEKSVVAIEKGVFKGFGYFQPQMVGEEAAQIREAVQTGEDNQDVRRIIIGYLRKNKEDLVVRYKA